MPTAHVLTAQKLVSPLMGYCASLDHIHNHTFPVVARLHQLDSHLALSSSHLCSARMDTSILPILTATLPISAPRCQLGVQPLGNNSQSPAPYLECLHTYILP